MKRILSLILCAAVLFAAAACTVSAPDPSGAETPSGKTGEYVFDLGVTADSRFFETDDSIYCLNSSAGPNTALDIIYFSDKENKLWMPLCGRPDCSHRTDDCNARFEGALLNGVWLYGDHIYYLTYSGLSTSSVRLWRMGLDGSDHTNVLDLSLSPEGKEYATEGAAAFFHNKYVVLTYHGEIGETMERFYWIVDLSAEQPEKKALTLKFEDGTEYGNYLSPVAGRGSMLLLKHLDTELYRADLEDGAIVKLCDLPYYLQGSRFTLNGDKLIVSWGYDLGLILSVDIVSGEIEEVNSAEPKSMQWYRPYKDYIFGGNGSNTPELWYTEIYDINGGLLAHIPHEDYENAELMPVYAVGNYVFGSTIEKGVLQNGVPLWYIDIREIGTDALAWHKWEKADNFRPGSAQG